MTYNYHQAILDDVMDYIKENYTNEEIKDNLKTDREGWEQDLNNALWVEDSVTGNASGSYTFNRYKAKEYVLDNMELLNDAMNDYCIEQRTIAENFLNEEWEYFDVSIRCYLLSMTISECLDVLEDELETN